MSPAVIALLLLVIILCILLYRATRATREPIKQDETPAGNTCCDDLSLCKKALSDLIESLRGITDSLR